MDITREAWLTRLAEKLIARFAVAPRGPWRVTCGWPSTHGTARVTRRLAECWSPKASADGTIEIIVSIGLDDPLEVAAALAHELGHAHLPDGVGHRGAFPTLMRSMGLLGKPTATVAGPAFQAAATALLAELPSYPHRRLDYTQRKKQATRMIRARCECGYTVRLTRLWLAVAVPRCPVHQVEMQVG